MADDEELQPVVIDNGSALIKAGFAGDDAPVSVIPTRLGRRRRQGRNQTENQNHSLSSGGAAVDEDVGSGLSGESAQWSYAMENGIVTNWSDMEEIWWQVYRKELRVDPEERPVLLTEAPLNPKANKEMTAQVLFESFNVPAMYVAIPAQLSAYASGRACVLVIECGDGVIYTMPIYEGRTVRSAILRQDFGGRDITAYLAELLRERGYCFSTPAELDIVRDIKETLCYVSSDGDVDKSLTTPLTKSSLEKCYTLPDGETIVVGSERFRGPEVLFQPGLIGMSDNRGIHELAFNSIMNCEADLRSMLFNNVYLSGRSTLFPGMLDRMKREISALVPATQRSNVLAPPDRAYSVWIGGSILASLSTFQELWITREEYFEYGPTITHLKCL